MNQNTYQFALSLTQFVAAFHAGQLKYPDDVAVELDKLAALAWSEVRSPSPSVVILPGEVSSDSPSQ